MKSLITILLSAILSSVVAASVVTVMADDGALPPDRVSEQRIALGAAFTYQGRLDTGSGPATGLFDFEFRLFDALALGNQVATTPVFIAATKTVTNGLFVVDLDFGAGVAVFDGAARWLEVRARANGGGGFDTLAPRQQLTPVPYALHAPWSGLTGVPAGFADGVDADTLYTAVPGGGLTLVVNAFNADPTVLQKRVGGTCAVGSSIRVINQDGTVDCEIDDSGWSLTGNAGTVLGTNFIGTTDNQPLELRVNNQPALRIVPAIPAIPGSTPNMIGGFWNNQVNTDRIGATIGGGGGGPGVPGCNRNNRVRENFATVGGGCDNRAGGGNGTAQYSTIAGGAGNTTDGYFATVGGGQTNGAGDAYATVGGGERNAATGFGSIVPGGNSNTASGYTSFAAGHRAKATTDGTFTWADTRDFDYNNPAPLANQFNVRATGGVLLTVGINGTTGASNAHCSLVAPAAGWVCSSDRNLKTNFVDVDGRDVLAKLEEVPIQRWTAKDVEGAPAHMGPMAQDFFAAFGLGDSDKSISTIDLDGVSLAAIKGLHTITKEQEARIAALEARLADGAPSVRRPAESVASREVQPAPVVTVVRETQGPSDTALWGVAAAITLFACGLFAVALRRRSEPRA